MAHEGPISGIAVGPTRLVATAGYDSQVILWNSVTGRPTGRGQHDHLVNSCTFSADGGLLYSASSDYTARVWRTRDMHLLQVLNGHKDDVEMVVPHPSGRMVATCSRDGTIRLYDQEGMFVARLDGHEADVISLAWAGNGDRLVSSGDDATIRVWSAVRGEALAIHRFDGVETDTVAPVSERLIFSGNDNGEVIVICDSRVHRLPAHQAGIKRVVADRRTRSLIATSYDGEFTVWNYDDDGGLALRHRARYPAAVWPRSCAVLSPNQLVFGTFRAGYARYDVQAERWSYADETVYESANALLRRDDEVYTIGDAGVLLRDGAQIAKVDSLCNTLADWGGRLVGAGQSGVLYDLERGEALYRHHTPINIAVVAEVADRVCLFLGGYTGEVVRLEAKENGVRVAAQTRIHPNAIKGLAVANGQVFTVCANGDAALCDARTLRAITRMPSAHNKIANGCVALTEGRFASVSRDLTLRLWDGSDCRVIKTPHDHSIKAVAASRNGRIIATTSYSGQLALFDVEEDRWIINRRVSFYGLPALEHGFGDQLLCADYRGRVYKVDWFAEYHGKTRLSVHGIAFGLDDEKCSSLIQPEKL